MRWFLNLPQENENEMMQNEQLPNNLDVVQNRPKIILRLAQCRSKSSQGRFIFGGTSVFCAWLTSLMKSWRYLFCSTVFLWTAKYSRLLQKTCLGCKRQQITRHMPIFTAFSILKLSICVKENKNAMMVQFRPRLSQGRFIFQSASVFCASAPAFSARFIRLLWWKFHAI